MKKVTALLILLVMAHFSKATIRTVSNNPSTIAQFSTIQAAIDASANGDSIYVHGSPNTYAQFDIFDKKVAVFGPGWAPDKNLPLQAIVSGCRIANTSATGSPDGSELHGLLFTNTARLATSEVAGGAVNNLRVIRCQFNQVVSIDRSAAGILLEGCLFLTSINFNGGENYTNLLFQNNIIFANACCTGASVQGLTNAVNVRFDHNLFYSDGSAASGGVPAFGNNNRFLTLTNNIFNKRNPASNLSFSTFNNNITFNSGALGDTAWIRNNNIDGGGNIAAQDPQMADQTAVNNGAFSGLLNFTIAGGPANNAGSDGKDIGLLYDAAGSLNWANSRNTRLPRIFSMNILNPTVAPGNNINVTVEARVSN